MKEEILEQTVADGQLDRSRKGLEFKRYYTQEGLLAVRRRGVGIPHRRDHERVRRGHLRAEERRSSQELVDDGDQHRRLQVFSWEARDAGT